MMNRPSIFAAGGQCLCGAVRFTVDSVDPHHHACHCGMCRRWTGGPLLAASVSGATFEGQENITVYDSSDWAERGFCRHCGANLFYRLKQIDQYAICIGSFDDSTQFKLIGEYFIDQKPDGYDFAGDHPRLTEAETIAKFSHSTE